jgi:phosphate starvation-inducible protein PhoH
LRSTIQSFEIGFTPGNINEKIAPFESPYKYMVKYMFQLPTDDDFEFLYGNLKAEKLLDFMCVSFLRGTTFDNCILIIDEFQNLNYHLLSSVITRVGSDCKILFSGDSKQTDLIKTNDRQGLHDFMRVLNIMPSIDMIEFTIDDVVRSGLVKEFLIAEHTIGI